MSTGARKLSPEPDFKRNQRKRPRKQLVARVLEGVDDAESLTGYGERWQSIHRIRIVQRRRCRRREGLPPGEDGHRWTCTCDERVTLDDRRRVMCSHLEGIIHGTLPEERPATGEVRYRMCLYTELTTLGERILRPLWAQAALRGMQP